MTQPPQQPWQRRDAGGQPPADSQRPPDEGRGYPGAPPGSGGSPGQYGLEHTQHGTRPAHPRHARESARPWARHRGSPYPRPRGKSNAPIVAASIGAVAVLVLGIVVAVSLTHHGGDGGDKVAGAGYGAGQTTTRSPPPPSSSPRRTPPPSSSSPPSGGGTPPSASVGNKILKLADHPLLLDKEAGLANRACNLPPWRSTESGSRAFFSAAADCLNTAWGSFLRSEGMPFTPPELHFPTGSSFQTACGNIEVGIATAAYYCEDNLYVPFGGLQTSQYGDSPGIYLALFAHEYGHHVQEVTGIMDAAWQQIYQVGQNSPAGLDMARRKELQAQCFSGMFLGAHVDRGGTVTRDMYNRAWTDQETRGDNTSGSQDHGTNAHYAAWWRDGARDNRIVDCNTFAASTGEVN